jgi:hypothetical protein
MTDESGHCENWRKDDKKWGMEYGGWNMGDGKGNGK